VSGCSRVEDKDEDVGVAVLGWWVRIYPCLGGSFKVHMGMFG
jgi:hypothetical protein